MHPHIRQEAAPRVVAEQLGTCLVPHLLQRLLQLTVLQKKLINLPSNHKIILVATAHLTPSWMNESWVSAVKTSLEVEQGELKS